MMSSLKHVKIETNSPLKLYTPINSNVELFGDELESLLYLFTGTYLFFIMRQMFMQFDVNYLFFKAG